MEAGLPADARMPQMTLRRTDPAPAIGIVHLGLGAFFRAHGAIYIEEAMAASGGDWGILGVSLQRPDIRDALQPQDGLYTALELGPQGETTRIVTSVTGVLVAPENPQAVLEAMADPGVRIVSLTVTEKGYCHEPATGRLDDRHPDVIHDLTNPLPRSAIGFLVRALDRRRGAGLRPFTVLTCDNLPGNGHLLRGLVLDFARRIDPVLARWIEDEVRFPATMVDRIVPATTPEVMARVATLTGMADRAPVQHEPFRQWVVEDSFVDGQRPDLAAVGVELVADVTAHEIMKLRMLNGTHSSLAYLGYLAGHETIADTVADPVFARFVSNLWTREIIPAIAAPTGVNLHSYADRLFERYRNPGIRHRTWQIAMDGSQKLPQRILGTLAENQAAGRESPGLILAVAAWMRYVGGVDEWGQPIDVRDPMSARLRAAHASHDTPEGLVAALLGLREIFPEALSQTLGPQITTAYKALVNKGARRTIEELA
jgi:fructuronate reductase